jgi:hypothetical protein
LWIKSSVWRHAQFSTSKGNLASGIQILLGQRKIYNAQGSRLQEGINSPRMSFVPLFKPGAHIKFNW